MDVVFEQQQQKKIVYLRIFFVHFNNNKSQNKMLQSIYRNRMRISFYDFELKLHKVNSIIFTGPGTNWLARIATVHPIRQFSLDF